MDGNAKLAFQRPTPISLSTETKLKLEALATMLQQPMSVVVERTVLAYIGSLPEKDRDLIESLAARAAQSLAQQSGEPKQGGTQMNGGRRLSRTVTGKEFAYIEGSVGIEVFFENSPPLRISHENMERIKHELVSRKGPALMGAIFSPLMPHSIGKAIHDKYGMTPINLSYVVPLLREAGIVRAFKEGRNWYVEGVNPTTKQ